MNERLKVKLGDRVDSCLGKMLDAEKNCGDYQPYLANVNVRWGDFDLSNLSLMKFEPSEAERYGIKNGDLIICEGGEPGRCAIWHEQMPNMKIQKALHRVRAKNGLDIRYLYYWLLLAGKTGRLERYFTGSTIKHLPGDSLSEIEIELPSIGNQKAISTILDNIDRKISLNNAINAELEKAAKLLYDYWFVQFDFPNAEGKPYRVSGGKMVYNEQLKRKIPKGWRAENFADIARITTGKEDANFSTPNGNYKFFTCSKEPLRCDIPAFNGQAVLIAGNGDFNVKHYSGEFNAYQRTYVIQPNNSLYYSAMYIASNDVVDILRKGSYGSIVKFITLGDVQNIKLLISDNPMVYIQLNKIYKKIELLEKENEHLAALRDFLLPLLMNGQVTVAAGQQ
jgi:type I restriction enzyme S subunit